jgi:capsular exopolysaccharide synthesis family protein
MTTLPQTTPIRLPRPAGGSPLVGHSAGPAAVGSGAIQMSGADVWRVIRANLWLVVLLVVISGIAGYFVNGYLEKNYAIYTATGYIRILPLQEIDPLHPVAPGAVPQTLLVEQKTEAQLIHSDGLINDVLSDSTSPIRQTAWWLVTCNSDPQKARRLLSEKLVATPLLDSQLISVSMSASDRHDTSVIVTAIVNKEIENNRAFINHKNDADYSRMLDAKNRYQNLLTEDTSTVESLAASLNLSGLGTVGASPLEIELSRRVEDQLAAHTDANKADAAYSSFMSQYQQGQDPPQLTQMVKMDGEVATLRSQAEYYDSQLSIAQGTFGSSSPVVQDMQKRRDYFEHEYEKKKADVTAEDWIALKSELLAERDNTKKAADAIDAKVEEIKNKMAELSSKMATYQTRRAEQERDREAVEQYTKELDNMDQMARSATFSSLDWAQGPIEPDSPTYPDMRMTMTVSIMVGLILSLGIAFLRELADTTVRSPRDIQRVGQMSLLGMVPHEADDPQAAGARLPLVIFEAPHSMMAEQLRQVRTRLQHAASLDTTRSILVTSPSPGDGKSTVAVNLAAGLALNGRRILLVDANFRRPELHRIFGIGNELGFSDVLNDVNAFATAVKDTPVPNLSVMCTGPRPSNPTELLESQLLLDFIERCLEEYDHVIFDSGPMLFVSDSVALAPRVDGVVTVVRARANTRGVLTRMRDALRSVKAEHLGVVLNGVRSQAGGYYGRSIKTYYAYQNDG